MPSESFHRSSLDSRTCYPRRAFNQELTDDSPGFSSPFLGEERTGSYTSCIFSMLWQEVYSFFYLPLPLNTGGRCKRKKEPVHGSFIGEPCVYFLNLTRVWRSEIKESNGSLTSRPTARQEEGWSGCRYSSPPSTLFLSSGG